ncbi:hypothetical protein BFRIG_01891 [Peribacillus frigoritolerans]|uniref:abortive infection system antitoxin AbiGi family protein n=1 Tax=Peribacillus frigoritolerans TaxID=450367 RepID=UPI0030CB4A5F
MVQKTYTDKLHVIKLKETPEIQSAYIPPIQSANVLFKFMGQLDYLKEIIKNKAIIPRYYEEKIDYLNIEDLDKVAFPMSCFCDIHLNKLVSHMSNYGQYGIGLSKQWGIRQGIQPIHYINQHSELRKDFSKVFANALETTSKGEFTLYNNYLLHDLFFMKPLDGQMFRDNRYETRNFHDEKEWRFIPNFNGIETDLPMVIDQEQMNYKSYNAYSQGIRKRPELWLNFSYDAIKHIIVSDQNDREELIDYIIEHQIGENDNERYILFSKILVFNELREDW